MQRRKGTKNTVNIEKINNYLAKIAKQYGIPLNKLIDPENDFPTPLGYIIYRKKKPNWAFIKTGRVLIRKTNGKSLFMDPIVRLYHEYLFRIWKPKPADLYIGLPCTSKKPYKTSVTHRMMNKYVNDLQKRKGLKIRIISISEPMLIVPQEYEELFPLSNYDFPPKLMDDNERELMIRKISELFPKLVSNVRKGIIFVLPTHHYNIVSEAYKRSYLDKSANNIFVVFHGYGRFAFKTLRQIYDSLLEDNYP